MGDKAFPSAIKPLTSKSYTTKRGSNVAASPVGGGLPRIGLDKTIESPEFNLNFILSQLQMQVLMSFYDGAINHGANSFTMNLDSGNGIESHLCNIKPGTWAMSLPVDGTWYLAMTVIAESTSSQLSSCSNLYDLYACYGNSLGSVIDGLAPVIDAMPDA